MTVDCVLCKAVGVRNPATDIVASILSDLWTYPVCARHADEKLKTLNYILVLEYTPERKDNDTPTNVRSFGARRVLRHNN